MRNLNLVLSLLFVTVSTFFISTSQAQENNTSVKVHGNVIDSVSKKYVSYSTIEVYVDSSRQPLHKAFTDDQGMFALNEKPGNQKFMLLIKTVGYRDKRVIIPISNNYEVNLGTLVIIPEAKILSEVQVKGSKQIIERKIDGFIFNPDLTAIQNSATVNDLLAKAPLVSADQNGQLYVRGKPGVRIYLNDRPASLEIIKALPAGSVSRIEIITNPSVKYDAEGGSVINVITKKSKIDGFEATAMVGGGIYDRINSLANVAIKKSKLNIALTYTLNKLTNNGITEATTERPTYTQKQNGTVKNKQFFQAGTISADLEIDSLNKVGTSINIYQYILKKKFNNHYATSPLDPLESFNLDTYDHIRRSGGYGDISYTHLFGKSGKTLSIAVLHNELRIKDNLSQNQIPANDSQSNSTTNSNNEVFKETTYQISFSNPFKNKSKVEIGSKLIERDNLSNYSNPDDSTRSQTDETALFDYHQHIFSFYGLYNFSIKKFNLQLGIRDEITSYNYLNSNNGDNYKDTYNNLFPNVNVAYRLPKDQQIKVSYSERIQRPGIFYLNPYRNILDPQNITTGTPELIPEVAYQTEIDYSKNIGKSFIDVSVNYTKTSHAITSFTSVFSDESLVTNFTNAGSSKSYSGNLFFSTIPVKNDNLSLSFQAENYKISNLLASNKGWNYYASFRNSYSWKNNFSLILNLNYFSQQITLQGKSPGSFSNSLSISKGFLERKLLLSILTDDPFRLGGVFKGSAGGNGFSQSMHNEINLRTIQLRAIYNFGKRSSTKPHESKVKNTDLKNGGL